MRGKDSFSLGKILLSLLLKKFVTNFCLSVAQLVMSIKECRVQAILFFACARGSHGSNRQASHRKTEGFTP